ncbi:MAG: acyltransferase, partial [Bacteroidia bacterium]|nr:acyltransferase [Bacteroidia bacterium]
MRQVNIIDSLRAFAAISVCLFHFICTTVGLEYPAAMSAVFAYGQNGVLVFFVISGFIIPWSMYYKKYRLGSVFKFMAKRLIRLEPPYLASILLILIIAFVKNRFHIGVEATEAITPARIGLHFGYLINFFPEYKWLNNVYWTLAIEFQYYLIMSFLYLFFVHKSLWLRILAYLLCFGMAWFVPDTSANHFPAYAPLFLFGICVFQYKANLVGMLECGIVMVACFIYNYAAVSSASACFGLATALVILFFSGAKVPVLDWLGKMSYSIYLIHPVVGAAVINF